MENEDHFDNHSRHTSFSTPPQGPYACYAQTYDGLCFLNSTSAGPWVLFVIALVAFIGLFVHHRRSMGQSLNPWWVSSDFLSDLSSLQGFLSLSLSLVPLHFSTSPPSYHSTSHLPSPTLDSTDILFSSGPSTYSSGGGGSSSYAQLGVLGGAGGSDGGYSPPSSI